jgi:DNA helicase-2/ATP-dependent DNA helicase PcrA
MHSSKGCEWKVVYVIHAADGMIPSDMATTDDEGVDEERRLFYVAVTRAMDRLYIMFPLRYYHKKHRLGDAHLYAQLTRFLPTAVTPFLEERVARRRYRLDSRPVSTVQTDEDIRNRISEFWREGGDG